MESDIRFCRNSQGAKIAYAAIGEGPLLVLAPDWISNLVLHQANPAFQAFLAALCKHHTILYYDKPGTGLSERCLCVCNVCVFYVCIL